MKNLVAVSILTANFACIDDEVKKIENAGADMIHCDVMDGVFVPNITFGSKMVADLRKITSLPLDVHLMITRPERYIDDFIAAGSDILTIHYESTEVLDEIFAKIKANNIKVGVVISPDTSVEVLRGRLKNCDLVLLMSVYPGFGGQKFIEKSIERLEQLSAIAKDENPNIMIQVDGGVNLENIERIKNAGANVFVAGNVIFGSSEPKKTLETIKEILNK